MAKTKKITKKASKKTTAKEIKKKVVVKKTPVKKTTTKKKTPVKKTTAVKKKPTKKVAEKVVKKKVVKKKPVAKTAKKKITPTKTKINRVKKESKVEVIETPVVAEEVKPVKVKKERVKKPKREAQSTLPAAKKPVNYLKNADLLAEVLVCQQAGRMSDKLARMLMLLVSNYAKTSKFINYTYNEDMQAYALLVLTKKWAGFKIEKSTNPFAYYTQGIHNCFIQYITYEKNQRRIRDKMMVDVGMNPSYGYQEEYKKEHSSGSDDMLGGIPDPTLDPSPNNTPNDDYNESEEAA